MPNYTVSYNTDSTGRLENQSMGGWPSFYSFFPDYMIGMNSYFYSFSGGNLWRHNTNEQRNTYYGTYTASSITSAFNPEPTISIKLFKTLSYESNTTVADSNEARWSCTQLQTDLTDGLPGSMLETYFQQKEGEWFSFIRTNVGTVNWSMRSANGIGACSNISGTSANRVIDFTVPVGSILSIGDVVYAVTLPATIEPKPAGIIIARTSNSITINGTPTVDYTLPTVGQYIMYIKNSQAESHGARGYYLQFKLENNSTSPVELYSVGSSVMKSYP